MTGAVAVAGCGSSMKVTLQGAERLNPDPKGRPLSVVVRIYQLSSKDRFQKGDYVTLARTDEHLLDGDLLAKREITLHPNTKEVVKDELKDGTRYIAVMALFRDPSGAWRQVVALKDLWFKSISVKVGDKSITSVD
jgi:type VI secretion system protein VasD